MIEYYLDHPDECAEIARAGQQQVRQHHTSLERAKTWVEALGTDEVREKARIRARTIDAINSSLEKVYRVAADAYGKAGIEPMNKAYQALIAKLS